MAQARQFQEKEKGSDWCSKAVLPLSSPSHPCGLGLHLETHLVSPWLAPCLRHQSLSIVFLTELFGMAVSLGGECKYVSCLSPWPLGVYWRSQVDCLWAEAFLTGESWVPLWDQGQHHVAPLWPCQNFPGSGLEHDASVESKGSCAVGPPQTVLVLCPPKFMGL
jgi:hypothetical protein